MSTTFDLWCVECGASAFVAQSASGTGRVGVSLSDADRDKLGALIDAHAGHALVALPEYADRPTEGGMLLRLQGRSRIGEEVTDMAHQHGPTTSAQLVSPAPGDEVVPAAEPRAMALPPQPAEVAALLRKVEWVGAQASDSFCYVCQAVEPGPHAPDCALALMLARCEP